MCVCICVPWQPRNAIGVDRTTLLYIYNENKKKKEFCHELLLSCRARNRGVPAVYAMREGRLLGQSIGVLSNKLYFRWLMRMCRSFPVGRSWGCQCHAAAALLALLRSYVYYLYTCCLSTQRTHTDQLAIVSQYIYALIPCLFFLFARLFVSWRSEELRCHPTQEQIKGARPSFIQLRSVVRRLLISRVVLYTSVVLCAASTHRVVLVLYCVWLRVVLGLDDFSLTIYELTTPLIEIRMVFTVYSWGNDPLLERGKKHLCVTQR